MLLLADARKTICFISFPCYADYYPFSNLVRQRVGAILGLAREQVAGGEGAAQARVILISTYAEDDFADMIADSPALSFLPKSGLSGAAIRGILRRAGGEP